MLGLAESVFTSLICGLAGSMGQPKLMGAIMAGQGAAGCEHRLMLPLVHLNSVSDVCSTDFSNQPFPRIERCVPSKRRCLVHITNQPHNDIQ